MRTVFVFLAAMPALGPRVLAEDSIAKKFDREIAPLLVRRCFECHDEFASKGGLNLSRRTTTFQGGDSGPALAAGKAKESLLWQRVQNGEMPPGKPLPAAEKKLLQDWIASGANWGADPIDPYVATTEQRAGYDWWSLQPLRSVSPPASTSNWIRNPIDAFVLARLEQNGLAPSPEADRRTLIRRLFFDMLGLPPASEEVDAFVEDTSPDAYERLVDHVLASPHYGVRWARHWLDVVRFGESQGFERDKLRPNAWRYRDWVTQSINADLPYQRFVRLQIAGDRLPPQETDGIVATGFLTAGPYDEVGQSQQSQAMRKVVRQDEMEDLIASVGQTFLGLTVNCARCHDHKFDPVRQTDYYRLQAALAGVRHGVRSLPSEPAHGRAVDSVAGIEARLRDLKNRAAAIESLARRRVLDERKANPPKRVDPPSPISRWEFNGDFRDAVGALHGEAFGGARTVDGRLILDGKGYVATSALKSPLREKTLEVWLSLTHLEQRGGGAISVQTRDGRTFDAVVFGEREPGRWMAGSNFFLRSESFGAGAEEATPQQTVHLAIVYREDGAIAAYRNGHLHGTPYKSKGLVKFVADESQVLFGLRHTPAGDNKHLLGTIDRAQLYDVALTDEQVAASAGVANDAVSSDAIAAALSSEEAADIDRLRFEIAHLERWNARAAQNDVYAVAPATPDETRRLHRGNPADPREIVEPGGVAALRTTSSDFELTADSSDEDRRIKLADWVADERQPLFWRVIVNRLWHFHFGAGIVETCNDFGFNGGRPSHPELLDWMAGELRRRGGRLKDLHRLMLTSSAYRQGSRDNGDALRKDAGNRWLWRKSPRRLDAESLRDAMLSISGELTVDFGGPGFEDFTTFNRNSQFYEMADPVGESFQRRTLYRTWVRSGRSPFLDVFDCPDPSTFTPQRAVTTTPLQSLALLNSSFSLRMADRLAQRLRRDAGAEAARQVALGRRLVFGRPATEKESRLLSQFAETHGLEAVCRAWFNSNEFLEID